MTIRLLGPQVQIHDRVTPDGWQWIRKAPTVKTIGDVRILQAADPRAITVFREPDERDLLATMLNHLNGYKPKYVEGKNEWKAQLPDLAEHVDWTTQFTKDANANLLPVAGFSVAPGNWDLAEIQYLMSRGWGGVQAVAYHAYWGLTGPLASEWVALRYRKWYDWTGGKMPPLLLTECGRDAIKQEGAEKLHGWKTQGISPEAYYAELVAFDQELQKDAQKLVFWQGRWQPSILGGQVFILAGNDAWPNYEVAEFAGRFARDSEIVANSAGGATVAWDRHAEFDSYQKVFGGQGQNPNDAFGHLRTANPGVDYGVLVGSYRGVNDATNPFITAWTTTGIFWYRKATGEAGFATREESLPLA